MTWRPSYSSSVSRAARRMDAEEFRTAMEELDHPYSQELMTPWEQDFYESMLEHLALDDYRFSERQVREIFKIREKYDLDIQHGEAIR